MKIALLWILAATAQANPPLTQSSFVYDLTNLRPLSFSQHNIANPPSRKLYLNFENVEGMHSLVYDESPLQPALGEPGVLRQMMANWNSLCSVELECVAKAFCVGDCRRMYYELTNAPADAAFAEKNKCRIRSFGCAAPKGQATPAAPAARP